MKIIFLSLFLAVSYLIVYKNISPYKFNIKDYIYIELSIVISYILLSLINKDFSLLSIYVIPIFFIYKKNYKILTSIFWNIFIYIIIAITDNFIKTVLKKIFNITINKSNNFIVYSIILLGIYLFSKVIGRLIYKYKIFDKYKKYIYLLLISIFGMFFININVNNLKSIEFLNNIESTSFIEYSIILLAICLIELFIMKKEEIFINKQIQLESLKQYTDSLEEVYMNMRKFRHDYINILTSISGFIEENNMTELEAYFNNTIYPLDKKMKNNNSKLALLKNIKVIEIKGLISSKVIKAQELGLNVHIDIMEEINFINMDIIDLIRSIGILLDNAIESSINTNEKYIALGFIKEETSINIVIINSYDDKINSIAKLFKQGYSTKGENRGLGLSNLKEIVDKNKNILLDTSIENNRFIQVLIINN